MTLLLMGCGGPTDGPISKPAIAQPTETTPGSITPGTDATAVATLVDGPGGNGPVNGSWQLNGIDQGLNPAASWDSGVTGSGQSEPSTSIGSLVMFDPTGEQQVQWDGTISLDFTDGTNASGINEVQTIPKPVARGGTFTVAGTAESTGPLAYNISMADLQTALNALSDIMAAGGVVVSGTDGGPWTVAWNNAGPQSLLAADGSGLKN